MNQKTNAIVSELHDEIYGLRCDIGRLEQENAKLRDLVGKLLYGLEHDVIPADALVWTQEVDTMLRELGIEA